MPYYAVAKGNSRGIFNNWDDCKRSVSGYKGASFKKFSSESAAKAFIIENSSSSNTYSLSFLSKSSSHDPDSYSSSSHSSPSYQSKDGSSTKQESADIYVDGACRGNGKDSNPPSGYGVYYGANLEKNAAIPLSRVDKSGARPTNQRAELYAMKHALEDINKELANGGSTKYTIHTDSQYTQKSLNEWSNTWSRNGWKNSKGQPVANSDIIKDSLKLLNDVNLKYQEKGWGKIDIAYVKGHAGNHGNEQADRLANLGADSYGK
ncbi:uncharacterized protein CANTADRAFT_58064 [Suhomyces tanzawaensis NRRL Y-17324]|uniref:Ribonuclease H n=1 Tax=Suhomyces tanzawaensis NRRL Y-17324 TaxID=984487 RepID=A0A1E4SAZ0_9ASCO|nr:uncharacterized protein CANTADRAFT_58064 [Suhomyces tanzawaensis NRRL Y-17324]ODV76690.1 hypothetical protein CANTADRAFT_58064 [Suhomyces tanzawaensis NRRL Y-17324]